MLAEIIACLKNKDIDDVINSLSTLIKFEGHKLKKTNDKLQSLKDEQNALLMQLNLDQLQSSKAIIKMADVSKASLELAELNKQIDYLTESSERIELYYNVAVNLKSVFEQKEDWVEIQKSMESIYDNKKIMLTICKIPYDSALKNFKTLKNDDYFRNYYIQEMLNSYRQFMLYYFEYL